MMYEFDLILERIRDHYRERGRILDEQVKGIRNLEGARLNVPAAMTGFPTIGRYVYNVADKKLIGYEVDLPVSSNSDVLMTLFVKARDFTNA